jgi:hypothetical protein
MELQHAGSQKTFLEWAHEVDFLESLKATYESQAGVPLNYRRYPVTKTDPQTNRTGKDTLWRQSAKRQIFSPLEAGGSLCLGSARGMAFRSAFGLHKPSNRQVLTKLKVENEDLETRYGIKNVKVVSASRKDAFDALKNGAPIIADLEGDGTGFCSRDLRADNYGRTIHSEERHQKNRCW